MLWIEQPQADPYDLLTEEEQEELNACLEKLEQNQAENELELLHDDYYQSTRVY